MNVSIVSYLFYHSNRFQLIYIFVFHSHIWSLFIISNDIIPNVDFWRINIANGIIIGVGREVTKTNYRIMFKFISWYIVSVLYCISGRFAFWIARIRFFFQFEDYWTIPFNSYWTKLNNCFCSFLTENWPNFFNWRNSKP